MLQYCFNWKSLSVAAGLTSRKFYFRLYAGAVKKEQVLDFLKALVRHLPGPLLLIWDRLPGHRSRLVQDYISSLDGWIHQEFLPPYAPCGIEARWRFIWGYWKQHELPEFLPEGLLPTGRSCPPHLAANAPSFALNHRLLAASFFVARMTLYYARLNNRLTHVWPPPRNLRREWQRDMGCVLCSLLASWYVVECRPCTTI